MTVNTILVCNECDKSLDDDQYLSILDSEHFCNYQCLNNYNTKREVSIDFLLHELQTGNVEV